MKTERRLTPAAVAIWVCAAGSEITLGLTQEAARAAHAEKFGSLPNRTFEFEETVWSLE